MRHSVTSRTVALGLVAAFLACVAAASLLFARALPLVALDQNLTPATARARAAAFAGAHGLPGGAQTAVLFDEDRAVLTYLDLEGSADTVRAVVRGRDYALYRWDVRWFTPGDPHETVVSLAPDGRVVGFVRKLADLDARPALTGDSARVLADAVRSGWLAEPADAWTLASASYETKTGSGRVDHTIVFERRQRALLAAPLRLTVTIAGDLPVAARRSVAVPQAFERRYREMRSANEQLALGAQFGIALLLIAVVLVLRRYSAAGDVRWRSAWIAAAVVGVLTLAAGLNERSLAWFRYDTATSATQFRWLTIAATVAGGALTALVLALTLAAAEAASRHAFPQQLSWWRWWPARGTREVAGRVALGYVLAAFGIAYVAAFYLVARRLFGWWVPAELIDSPNLMATPAPWLSAVATSLNAGVWEEALFRVLPLSLLSLWVGNRPHRVRWMAAGVVVTALVFGFAHASYASWPAYSRGVEIFLDACLWGTLVVWLGPLPTMMGHFLYDLVLFGAFTTAGTAPSYRVAAAFIAAIVALPALLVGWRWWRQGGLTDATAEDRFASIAPAAARAPAPPVVVEPIRTLSRRAEWGAVALAVVALAVGATASRRARLGAEATASRAQVLAVADSAVRTRSVDLGTWTRLARTTPSDSMRFWARFLRAHDADRLAAELATSYQPPAWWVVRYVRPHGDLEQRAEEWRVRVLPDGRLLDVRHLLPDAVWRDSVSADSARTLARLAVAHEGVRLQSLQESDLVVERRVAAAGKAQRTDITITYADTSVHLPGDALARVRVALAGDEVVLVRRSVELPEAFLREDAKRGLTQGLVAGGFGLAAIALLVVGVFLARRRSVSVDAARFFTRRRALIVLGALALVFLADALNQVPADLAGYDTTEPWSRFLTGIAGGYAGSMLGLAVAAGVWLVFESLRRRSGLVMLAAGRGGWRATLVAGLALAGSVRLAGALVTLSWHSRIAPPPDLSDAANAVPAVSGALAVADGFFWPVLIAGIAVLTIVLLARTPAVRVALSLLLVALLVASSQPTWSANILVVPPALFGTMLVAVLAMFVVVARTFVMTSVGAWLVASLLGTMLRAVMSFFHSAVAAERTGALLVVGVCVALMALQRRLADSWGTPAD